MAAWFRSDSPEIVENKRSLRKSKMDCADEESSQKRQKCSNSCDVIAVDRISYLPEPIICHILSFLPSQSVVATSLLSKNWRFLWTGITSFNFNDRWWSNSMNFVEFVNMFMLDRSESVLPIDKFHLKWYNPESQSNYLTLWLDIVICRKVRVVDLDMLSNRLHFDSTVCLPDELYTCKTLEILKLRGPFLIKVPTEVCLPKLLVLELKLVYFESEEESFCKLMCGCAVLQSLRIETNDDWSFSSTVVNWSFFSSTLKYLEIFFRDGFRKHYKLEVDAPSLEKLVVSDRREAKISISGGLRSISEANLDISCVEDSMDLDYPDSIVQLIEDLKHVKILKLSERTMEVLYKANSQLQRSSLWSTSFERLTKLVVKFDYFSQWSCMVNLIRRCPALVNLEITKLPGKFAVEERILRRGMGLQYWDSYFGPKCSLSCLTRVSYKGYTGLDDEMTLLMSFLNPAIVAKKVDLRTDFRVDSPNFGLRFSFVWDGGFTR